MNFHQTIVEATSEIFDTMIGLPARPGTLSAAPCGTFENSVSGILGLSGDLQGMLCVHCPDPVADAITSALLGGEGSREEVRDAIGELANMVAGSLKLAFAKGGKAVQLSLPTAVAGKEYSLRSTNEEQRMAVPFQMPDGEFLIELRYRWML